MLFGLQLSCLLLKEQTGCLVVPDLGILHLLVHDLVAQSSWSAHAFIVTTVPATISSHLDRVVARSRTIRSNSSRVARSAVGLIQLNVVLLP